MCKQSQATSGLERIVSASSVAFITARAIYRHTRTQRASRWTNRGAFSFFFFFSLRTDSAYGMGFLRPPPLSLSLSLTIAAKWRGYVRADCTRASSVYSPLSTRELAISPLKITQVTLLRQSFIGTASDKKCTRPIKGNALFRLCGKCK